MNEAEESILEELLAETSLLRRQEEENLNQVEELVIESLSIFSFQELEKELEISGVLLAEGIHKGTFYPWDKIKDMYNKFKSFLSRMPITVEHEKSKEYGNKEVGKHTLVKPNDILRALIYKAKITDPKAIKDIKNGNLQATSMRLKLKKLPMDGIFKVFTLKPINDTLTAYPACHQCQIFTPSTETLSELRYLGIEEKESLNIENIKELEEENIMEEEFIEESSDIEEELTNGHFELKSDLVGVMPGEEELGDKEGEIELELMTLEEALARKKKIVYYYPKGKYPKKAKKVKRKKVKGEYYVMSTYTGMPMVVNWTKKESTEEFSLEDFLTEELVEKGVVKVFKLKKTGKWVAMVGTGKKFPGYKIIGQFPSEAEAREATKKAGGKLSEELQDKDEKGCLIGKEEWDEEQKKCVALSEEEQSAWTDCIGKERKAGASFNEAVDTCKKKLGKTKDEEQEEKAVCPKCKQEFDTYEKFLEHWNDEHKEKYGKYEKLSEEQTEELRRSRCVYCEELQEDMEKHYEECTVRKDVIELAMKCKFCGETFEDEKALQEHLKTCDKYKTYKEKMNRKDEELSEEESTETETSETEESTTQETETETQETETQETSEESTETQETSTEESTEETEEEEETVVVKTTDEIVQALLEKEDIDITELLAKLMIAGHKEKK